MIQLKGGVISTKHPPCVRHYYFKNLIIQIRNIIKFFELIECTLYTKQTKKMMSYNTSLLHNKLYSYLSDFQFHCVSSGNNDILIYSKILLKKQTNGSCAYNYKYNNNYPFTVSLPIELQAITAGNRFLIFISSCITLQDLLLRTNNTEYKL